MHFEPTAYQKTLFIDLQAAWADLRHKVLHLEDKELRKCLLFHADESLGWNHVRHLPLMKHTLYSMHRVAYQQQANDEVQHLIEHIRLLLNELFASLNLDCVA